MTRVMGVMKLAKSSARSEGVSRDKIPNHR